MRIFEKGWRALGADTGIPMWWGQLWISGPWLWNNRFTLLVVQQASLSMRIVTSQNCWPLLKGVIFNVILFIDIHEHLQAHCNLLIVEYTFLTGLLWLTSTAFGLWVSNRQLVADTERDCLLKIENKLLHSGAGAGASARGSRNSE